MAGVLIDRFGKDIMLHSIDEEHFSAIVEVAISKQFLGWVIALGENIRITAPKTGHGYNTYDHGHSFLQRLM